MERFVTYRPFEFKVSFAQRVADLVTLIALGVCGIVLVTVLGLSIAAAVRGRSGATVG